MHWQNTEIKITFIDTVVPYKYYIRSSYNIFFSTGFDIANLVKILILYQRSYIRDRFLGTLGMSPQSRMIKHNLIRGP